jgi:hypothetical protein
MLGNPHVLEKREMRLLATDPEEAMAESEPAGDPRLAYCEIVPTKGRLRLPQLHRRCWFEVWLYLPDVPPQRTHDRSHDHMISWLPGSRARREMEQELNQFIHYLERTGWRRIESEKADRPRFQRPLDEVLPRE